MREACRTAEGNGWLTEDLVCAAILAYSSFNPSSRDERPGAHGRNGARDTAPRDARAPTQRAIYLAQRRRRLLLFLLRHGLHPPSLVPIAPALTHSAKLCMNSRVIVHNKEQMTSIHHANDTCWPGPRLPGSARVARTLAARTQTHEASSASGCVCKQQSLPSRKEPMAQKAVHHFPYFPTLNSSVSCTVLQLSLAPSFAHSLAARARRALPAENRRDFVA